MGGAAGAIGGGMASWLGGANGAGAYAWLQNMPAIGRNTLIGGASGAAGGAFDGGAGYVLGPGPHTVDDLLDATGRGAAMGGTMGAGVRGISPRRNNDFLARGVKTLVCSTFTSEAMMSILLSFCHSKNFSRLVAPIPRAGTFAIRLKLIRSFS